MRASIPNTEQLKMSENNDIKEEKRQSMRLAMWKYLRRQDTENTQGIGIEEKRNGNPLSGKPTLFQQEEEESNTDEREKRRISAGNIRLTGYNHPQYKILKGKNYHPTRVKLSDSSIKV